MKVPLTTVFLAINHGITCRYFLQTKIFEELRKNVDQLVLLVPDPKDEYFKEYVKNENVVLERYKLYECEEYGSSNRIERFLDSIRPYIQNGKHNMATTEGIYQAFLKDQVDTIAKLHGIRRILRKSETVFMKMAVTISRKFKSVRRLILLIEHRFFSPPIHADVFDKYQPDMLIVSSLGTFHYDQYLMREARRRSVEVISVILSWDNTTTRGMPSAVPDKVLAWTDTMRKELIELNDIIEDKILVGGVAHYDHYFNNEAIYGRDKFYRELGLNVERDIIFLGTKSPNCYTSNAYIAKLILEAIQDGDFVNDCQLLVRMHPIYYRRNKDGLLFKHFRDEMMDLRNSYDHLTINEPVMASVNLSYSMPTSEINVLASILKYSSVVVNMFSTLNIEASIFDVPIVNVSFEGVIPDHLKKARYDINMDLEQSHNQRVITSGGVAMAYTSEQLIPLINQELSDPKKRRSGRESIVKREVGPNKGVAGQAIASLIMKGRI